MITWDEPKRIANFQKHGLDFEDVIYFDWATARIRRAKSNRFKAIGYFEDNIAVVIYAALGSEGIAIISFRFASLHEREMLYDSQV